MSFFICLVLPGHFIKAPFEFQHKIPAQSLVPFFKYAVAINAPVKPFVFIEQVIGKKNELA